MKAKWFILILLLAAMRLSAQTISIQPTNQVVIAGNDVTINAAVSGGASFTYQWQFNGTNLPNNIITTVAGNGTNTYGGDGGFATNASFGQTQGIAIDSAGNLFIADMFNNRVRKVNTVGIISTVAGNGIPSNSDGIAATNATLYQPAGVAVDTLGNIFIADQGNNLIRKVGLNGIISTVAGNGINAYSGDGWNAPAASLMSPNSLALDEFGDIFINGNGSSRIREINKNDVIYTFAGNSSFGYYGDGGYATNAILNGPLGLATDNTGNLFIADYLNHRIRKVSTNGIITTVAGNGLAGYSGDSIQATNSRLNYPSSVAVDLMGNLYIADRNNDRVRKVDANGIITTVAGNGIGGFSGDGLQATNASMYPNGVAVDPVGDVFIADTYNYRIRKVITQGSSYSIKNVSSTNTGSYNLIVTGSFGSITSSIVKLAVIASPPSITTPTMLSSGKFQFSFGTAIKVNYMVQCSTNLAQWFSLTNLGGIGTPMTLIDSNTADSQQRFYRISLSAQ